METLKLPKINRVDRCPDRLSSLREQSSQVTPDSCHPPGPLLQIHATLVALNTEDLEGSSASPSPQPLPSRDKGHGSLPPSRFVQLPAHPSRRCSPSESTHTVWCCPPENPTQDLVEFLKHVRFCGEKQGSVPWVPVGWDAQTQADQGHGHGQPGARHRH